MYTTIILTITAEKFAIMESQTKEGRIMSNTVKIIRSDGKTKNYLDVIGLEYETVDGNINLDITISGDGSLTHDFYIESVILHNGDSAYLVNSMGTTVDMVRLR